MSNIEPSNNSPLLISAKKRKVSWNIFKNTFMLPVLSVGLIVSSGYLFFSGQQEVGASLAGAAVAAMSVNQDDKDENQAIQSGIENDELKKQLLEKEKVLAKYQEQLKNVEMRHENEKKLLEEQYKNVFLEKELKLLQEKLDRQSRLLPEGKNQPFNPQIENKIAELKNPDNLDKE